MPERPISTCWSRCTASPPPTTAFTARSWKVNSTPGFRQVDGAGIRCTAASHPGWREPVARHDLGWLVACPGDPARGSGGLAAPLYRPRRRPGDQRRSRATCSRLLAGSAGAVTVASRCSPGVGDASPSGFTLAVPRFAGRPGDQQLARVVAAEPACGGPEQLREQHRAEQPRASSWSSTVPIAGSPAVGQARPGPRRGRCRPGADTVRRRQPPPRWRPACGNHDQFVEAAAEPWFDPSRRRHGQLRNRRARGLHGEFVRPGRQGRRGSW